MNKPWIHEVNDGRGPCDVYLNGRLIKNVIYADERRGVIKAFDDPIKLDKYSKRVIARTLKGKVVVAAKG